jgi:hypothetical protein
VMILRQPGEVRPSLRFQRLGDEIHGLKLCDSPAVVR